MRMEAMLTAFRCYMLLPFSGSKCAGWVNYYVYRIVFRKEKHGEGQQGRRIGKIRHGKKRPFYGPWNVPNVHRKPACPA
jgi:hypothetical protein